MAYDEKSESTSSDEVRLLDSVFELLKGSRDQECQRALFGIHKDADLNFRELNSGARVVEWWKRLCCPEVQVLYRRNTNSQYDHNHLFSGFINRGPNKDSKRIYEKYLKPGIQNEPELIEDQRKHLVFLLEQGVVFGQFWNDMALPGSAISESDIRGTIEKSRKRLPEKCQKAVFGHDGIRNRFLEPQIARRRRIIDGKPKDSGHRKKDQKLPGPYEVLRRKKRADGKPQYTWFVTRASRGYLASCTDREIFFGVLAAAFVLGLNLDEDTEIDSKVEAYLKELVGDNQYIEEFNLLLTEFCKEKNAVELGTYPYRLEETVKLLIGSGWDNKDLLALIRNRKNCAGQEMDEIRNLYLEYLEKRVESECLFKKLTAGGLNAYFEIKSDLDICVEEMNRRKNTADELLDRLLKRNENEKKTVAQITAQTLYTIEF